MSTRQSTFTQPAVKTSGVRVRRLRSVAAAVLAAVTAWLLVEVVAGVELQAPGFDGDGAGQDVGLGAVAAVSLMASLAAWGVLALLERHSSRPRRIWTVLAAAGLLLSLGGPLSGTGVDTGNRVALAGFHLIVAGVLIPLLYRTASTPDRKG